jgi:hypothetical protein
MDKLRAELKKTGLKFYRNMHEEMIDPYDAPSFVYGFIEGAMFAFEEDKKLAIAIEALEKIGNMTGVCESERALSVAWVALEKIKE